MIKPSHKKRQSPNEIKAQLVLNGIKLKDIAESLGVSRPCVSIIISGRERSRRVEQAIADRLGLPYEALWGEPHKGKRAA